MHPRIAMKRAVISMTSFLFLTVFVWDASAAPIELENDVSVSWSDMNVCRDKPSLCSSGAVLVSGAPRLVRDARSVGELLEIMVDFLGVGLNPPGPTPNLPFTPLILNVGDLALNQVFRPGTDIPLQLAYFFEKTGFDEASDVVLNLTSFGGFDLLPPGDLIFTVEFKPTLTRTDSSADRPNQAVTISLSGPGIVVPEPASFVLLLSGLTSVGLGVGWRRIRRRASHPIG
jgi:PEP-CTERM motif-containing protein